MSLLYNQALSFISVKPLYLFTKYDTSYVTKLLCDAIDIFLIDKEYDKVAICYKHIALLQPNTKEGVALKIALRCGQGGCHFRLYSYSFFRVHRRVDAASELQKTPNGECRCALKAKQSN